MKFIVKTSFQDVLITFFENCEDIARSHVSFFPENFIHFLRNYLTEVVAKSSVALLENALNDTSNSLSYLPNIYVFLECQIAKNIVKITFPYFSKHNEKVELCKQYLKILKDISKSISWSIIYYSNFMSSFMHLGLFLFEFFFTNIQDSQESMGRGRLFL